RWCSRVSAWATPCCSPSGARCGRGGAGSSTSPPTGSARTSTRSTRSIRPPDRAFEGNVVQAMGAYARGELGEALVPLSACQRIIAIGSDRMMKAVKEARHSTLAQYFRPGHMAIASINSPMQCMMKEICAQCLQRHIDPATGKETIVFSCSNQDQPQDFVDWKNLADRLRQNTVQEKLTDLWVRRLLTHPEA